MPKVTLDKFLAETFDEDTRKEIAAELAKLEMELKVLMQSWEPPDDWDGKMIKFRKDQNGKWFFKVYGENE